MEVGGRAGCDQNILYEILRELIKNITKIKLVVNVW